MFVDCPLRRNALSNPLSPSIRDADRALTYAELDELVNDYGAALQQHGASAGDCVGILSRNSIEYVALLLAILRIRAVAVPLNIRLSSVELHSQISQLDLKLLVTDFISRETGVDVPCELVAFDQLLDNLTNSSGNDIPNSLDLDQVSCVCFTSGSDGKPKGVVLTFGNLYFSAMGSNENIVLTHADTWHLTLPLFHVGGIGIIFRCLLAGAQIYVAQTFEPNDINRLIDGARVTHLSLVPTMLARLLELRQRSQFPVSLKAILVSGAPSSPQLRESLFNFKVPVVYSYGLTETASQITATEVGALTNNSATCGRPLKYRELKIDESPGNAFGEICVRGEVLFKGYLGDSGGVLDSNGWFHTGDMGSVDDQGNLIVHGRKDEMFISGGENIFPQEIVDVAERIDGIVAAAVVAVDSETWGSRPIMFVEIDERRDFAEDKLLEEMSKSLARYKLPDRIVVLDSIPRTALGKIDRQALIRRAESV